MPEVKKANYTDEQADRVKEVYTAAETDADRKEAVEILAAELGRKPASIRAKLVSQKVYVKPVYVSKKGATIETKDKIVSGIATILNVTEAQLGGLEKATKPALELIRSQFLEAASAVNEMRAELSGEVQPDEK